MLKKIKKFFSTNLLLKAFSLIFAFFAWLIIVNQQDPVIDETVSNVPVTILNETYFEDRDQFVTVESEMEVDITVTGRRSVVENLDAEDFTATVDYLSVVPEEGKGEIQCSVNDRSVTIKRQSVSFIKLTVENIITKEFNINLYTEGTPAEGYMIVDQDSYAVLEPASVILTGPESKINDLTEAFVTVDVNGKDSDVSGKGKIIEFRTQDGNVTVLDELEAITDYSAKMMSQLSVPVYRIMEIPVSDVKVVEDEKSDYYVESSSLSVKSVKLYGPESTLSRITYLMLDQVVASGKTESFEKIYNLESICSTLGQRFNVRIGLAEGSPTEIVLTVNMVAKEIRPYEISNEKITYQNLAEGMICTFEPAALTVKLQGKPEVLDTIKAEDIQVLVDLAELTEVGTYEVNVTYVVPDVAGVKMTEAPERVTVMLGEAMTALAEVDETTKE